MTPVNYNGRVAPIDKAGADPALANNSGAIR